MKKILVLFTSMMLLINLVVTANTEEKVIMTVTTEVKDYDQWKKAFDAGEPARTKAGIKLISILVSVDNPNIVTVVSEASDAEVCKGFAANPDLKASMEKAGVISKPEIKIMRKIQ